MTREILSAWGENCSQEKVKGVWVVVPFKMGLLVEEWICDTAHAAGDETRAGEVTGTEIAENLGPDLVGEMFQQSHCVKSDVCVMYL